MQKNQNAIKFLQTLVKEKQGVRIKSQHFDHADLGSAAQQLIDLPILDEVEHNSWLVMVRKLRKAVNEF